MINPMDLAGKHIIVTGASSGVGRQVSLKLSKLGAKVSLIARNEERLKETLQLVGDSDNLYYVLDVSNISEIEQAVKSIVDKNGKVDGFVHAAGIGTFKPIGMSKYEFLLEMMQIHFFSFAEFVRVLCKKRYSEDGASIVAISSEATIFPDKGRMAYSSAKGALDASVRVMAVELGEARGFRVNTVNPGWIRTRMFEEYIDEVGQEMDGDKMADLLRGAADPNEVANIVAFLLSDEAVRINGQNIIVDNKWAIV